MSNPKPMAVTSCYLDRGESREYLDGQLQRMAEMKVEHYFLDVICRADQVIEAVDLLKYFYEQIAVKIPELPNEYIITGITCDNELRPAMSAAVVLTADTKVELYDTNPKRKRV